MIFVDTAAPLYHIAFMANLARDFLHNAHMKEDMYSVFCTEKNVSLGGFSI